MVDCFWGGWVWDDLLLVYGLLLMEVLGDVLLLFVWLEDVVLGDGFVEVWKLYGDEDMVGGDVVDGCCGCWLFRVGGGGVSVLWKVGD